MKPNDNQFDHLFDMIDQLIKLEKENVEQNSVLLQEMMTEGIMDIDTLDRVADRLLDSMHGITGAGEVEYRQYLDYIETINPAEAKKRKNDLEYDLGYKTHVLYAAAILCKTELEGKQSPNGQSSFDVIMQNYIPKAYGIKKKTASFLFFAHYGSGHSVDELMQMLQAITENTDFVLSHVDDFEDLMFYPSETYHPLREGEWQLIKYIVEHNIDFYEKHSEYNKVLLNSVFGNRKEDSIDNS